MDALCNLKLVLLVPSIILQAVSDDDSEITSLFTALIIKIESTYLLF